MFTRLRLALGLLVSTLLVHEAPAQSAVVAAPSISGRVSGRVVSSHAGLVADALVSLALVDASGAAVDPRTATSDRQGIFSFERVPAGRYQLFASKAGFTNRRAMPIAARDADRQPSVAGARFETALQVTVKSGEAIAGLELMLYRAASIAGRIAEPDGIPAPEVHVFAAARRHDSYALLDETRTTSEWDGRYEIANLPPGEYLVVVQPVPSLDRERALANAERRAPEAPVSTRPSFDPTLYPGVSQADRPDTVTLLEGIAVEGIDVWLTPAQRFSVSGRVLWPDGLAVENVAIEYSGLSAERSGLWTVSDPGGLFTITGVPAGTLVLLARGDSDRGPLTGAASTELSVGPVEDLRITLDKPGTVEGRVIYEAGVAVSARPTSVALRQRLIQVSALYPVAESRLGADGRFQIPNAFGEYEFELQGQTRGLRIKNVSRGGRTIPDGRIGVASGETITEVEILVGP